MYDATVDIDSSFELLVLSTEAAFRCEGTPLLCSVIVFCFKNLKLRERGSDNEEEHR